MYLKDFPFRLKTEIQKCLGENKQHLMGITTCWYCAIFSEIKLSKASTL